MILQKHSNYQPCDTALNPKRPDCPTMKDVYEHCYLHFRSLTRFMPNSCCWSRCSVPHTEAHNMTINQWTIWHFTVHCQPAYWGKELTHFYWDLLIEPEFWFTYAQPHHKHINIGRIDMHVVLFHGNKLSNQIHNIQITNKMHFNVYDVFYSLHSHQCVQGDTSIIIRIQRYKCCVVLLTLHHN